MIDLKAVKELLRITPPILEGSLLGPLYVPFMLKAHGLVSDLVAEVENLRSLLDKHDTHALIAQLAEANKEAAGMALQINDLHTEKMKLLDQLSDANNLAANLQMDKEDLVKALNLERVQAGERVLEQIKWEAKLTTLTEQHAKAVECLKWYAHKEHYLDSPGSRTFFNASIDADMGDKAKTCLKELGVKE